MIYSPAQKIGSGLPPGNAFDILRRCQMASPIFAAFNGKKYLCAI